AHRGWGKGSLEGAIIALDLGDELGDLVFVRDARRGDLLAFTVKTADEADLGEQLGSADAAEVEDAILLANLRGKHGVLPCKYGSAAGADRKYSRNRALTAKKRVQRHCPGSGQSRAAPCGFRAFSGQWTLQRAASKTGRGPWTSTRKAFPE